MKFDYQIISGHASLPTTAIFYGDLENMGDGDSKKFSLIHVLKQEIRKSEGRFRIDLCNVNEIDLSGLSVFCSLMNFLKTRYETELSLSGASDYLQKTLSNTFFNGIEYK